MNGSMCRHQPACRGQTCCVVINGRAVMWHDLHAPLNSDRHDLKAASKLTQTLLLQPKV